MYLALRLVGLLRTVLSFSGRWAAAKWVGLILAVGWVLWALGRPAAAVGNDTFGPGTVRGAGPVRAFGPGPVLPDTFDAGIIGAGTIGALVLLGVVGVLGCRVWDSRSSVRDGAGRVAMGSDRGCAGCPVPCVAGCVGRLVGAEE